MTPWTEAAKGELQNYFDRIQPGLTASGADANEVMEDLRRHLDAEIEAAGLRVVTEQDLRRLLAKIGAPEPPNEGIPAGRSSAEGVRLDAATASRRMGNFASGALLFAGVILPLITFCIEAVTHMCEAAFFNPLPTIWHGLLVVFVVIANGLAWNAVRRSDASHRTALGWANGAAIAIAAYYSFLFIPLLLPGVFAILFLGWGLLPWSPVLALIAAVVLRTKLSQLGPQGDASLPGFWRGLALGLVALALVEAPVILTRIGMQMAISASSESQHAGISWLRHVGENDIMLRACYGYTRGAQNMDMRGLVISGGQRISAEQAREVYYRVTGVPFNSVPPPAVRTGRGVWNELNDWTWDADHGGDQVGGRIRGLKLNASRLDSVVAPDAAWSYTEWTLEFRNDAPLQREARAQIQLPPGGVVSRVTLWVNGEEREAAFAGRSHVREAYQKIAVQRRRDPVLITTSGPDRVMLQCFPVPPNGGLMKVRVGITAPLLLPTAAEGIVRLPMFLERNFSIPKGVNHAVWVKSSESVSATSTNLAQAKNAVGDVSLRGQISNAELDSPAAVVRVSRDPSVRHAWTADTRGSRAAFIRQTLSERTVTPPKQVILVVDESLGMQDYLPDIAVASRDLQGEMPVAVLAAADGVVVLTNPAEEGGRTSADAANAVRSLVPVGGQDNVPALMQAWNEALQNPGAVVVWIHRPQPILLSPTEALTQAMERTPDGPSLYEVPVGIGSDRVIEKLNGNPMVKSVPRLGTLKEDLTRLFDSWKGNARVMSFKRERVESQSLARADSAVETSLHLARLWASEEVKRLQSSRKFAEAVQLAALYQIVTPVSGAVVLENKQQYEETGLKPVEPQTVPSIPEPTTGALLLCGILAAWGWRKASR